MKIRMLATASLLVALAACGGTAGNESKAIANGAEAPANATTAENSATATAPAAADLSTLSQAYIVGRWGEGDGCADALEFKADGTMAGSMFDGERWQLEGDQLTMVGNPDPLTVARIDDNHMTTTNARGRTVTVTRCTGAAEAPKP